MSHVHERLVPSTHDRAGLFRTDEAWVEKRWNDPDTRVLVVAGNRMPPLTTAVPWRKLGDAPEGVRVLLGERDGAAYFAVLTDRDHAEDDWVDLRRAFPALLADPRDTSFVMHAIGMAEWHRATRFCVRCAELLISRAAGHELACPNEHVTFPRLDPAVIMVITSGEPGSPDERCLLGKHARHDRSNWFTTLAGFCEPGESLEDAVRREVAEEAGVVVGEVTYFGNQAWPMPSSLMVGFTGRATSTELTLDPVELADARWFTRDDLREQTASGEIALPSGVSISRSLIEHWYGGSLPGAW